MTYRLTPEQIDYAVEQLLKDKPDIMGDCLNAMYRDLDDFAKAEEFHKKYMTPSLGIITVHDTKTVQELVGQIAVDIYGKTIVEIGAGVGLLACGMALLAKQVYAIEVDPAWSWAFTKILYEIKPPNLTFIFGKAESMIGLIDADVAIIVTHSGHKEMQEVGLKLAQKVIDVYDHISFEASTQQEGGE